MHADTDIKKKNTGVLEVILPIVRGEDFAHYSQV